MTTVIITVLVMIVLIQSLGIRIGRQALMDRTEMLEALCKISKAQPDVFDDPTTYLERCCKAVQEMAKIAEDCIVEVSRKYRNSQA